MASEDEGQIILLAGILLVLGFILFSTQISVLATLGQQLGREIENPLLEDYLLVRRHLDVLLEDEMRNSNGVVVCPNLMDYTYRARGQVELVAALEANRGQSLTWTRLAANDATATQLRLEVVLVLSDSHNKVSDEVTFIYGCSGTLSRTGCPQSSPDPCIVVE